MVMDRVGSIVGSGLRAGEWVGLWWSEKWGTPPFREREAVVLDVLFDSLSLVTWVRALDCRFMLVLGLGLIWCIVGYM